ncbi:hypothetical protein, partial [uncultured Megasphaera sp.]|uniref:hypothetical protein n=1 Tax=uncultured Megasphaera sp. TaxID=165188 RepID=UPI002803F361
LILPYKNGYLSTVCCDIAFCFYPKYYAFLSSEIVIVVACKWLLFATLFFKKNDHAGIFGLDYAFFDFRKSHFILGILEFKAVFHFFPVAAALFAIESMLFLHTEKRLSSH